MNLPHADFEDIEDESDDDAGKPTGYVLRDFDSRLEAEGALYALRIVGNARVYRRVFERRGFIDDDVIALLGIAPGNKRSKSHKVHSLRSAIRHQAALIEASHRSPRGALARNVGKLGDILRLSEEERRVLRFAVVATKVHGFTDLWSNASLTSEAVCEAIGRAVGMAAKAVGKALQPNGKLCRSGLFEGRRILASDHNPLELNSRVCSALASPRFEIEQFLRCLVRKGGKPRLKLEDYAHISDATVVRAT